MSLLLALAILTHQAPELPAPTPGWMVFGPAWSSDGTKILYSAEHIEPGAKFDPKKISLYIVNADGTGRKQLPVSAFGADFTADGKAVIAGLYDMSTSSLIRYDLESGKTTILLYKRARMSAPVCSPVADKIAFNIEVDATEHEQHLFIVNLDGSGEKEIQGGPGSAYTPMWSADGKQIVFYRELGDQRDQIYVMNADGSNLKHLSKSDEHNFYPAFLPNGDISFTNFIAAEKKQQVVVVDQEGNRKSVWPYSSPMVKWSKSGRAAFVSGKFPTSALYVANSDGSGAMKISE